MDVASIGSSFSVVPADWIILGALVGLGALDAYRVGSARIGAIGLSLLVTTMVFNASKKAIVLGPLMNSSKLQYTEALSFAALALLLFFLMRHVTIDYSLDGLNPISSLFASAATAAVLLVVWINTPALDSIWHFSSLLHSAFAEAYVMWWIIGALAILAYMRE